MASRQHILSQVLLRQFSELVDGARRVEVFDVRYGTTRQRATASVGYERNFFRHAPMQSEVLWQGDRELIAGRNPGDREPNSIRLAESCCRLEAGDFYALLSQPGGPPLVRQVVQPSGSETGPIPKPKSRSGESKG